MTEQLNTTEQDQQAQATEPQQVAASAATQNTETQATDGQPGPVPYERFKDINAQLKTAQTQLKKLQEAQTAKERAEMTELERIKAEMAERDEALAAAQAALKGMHLRAAFQREAQAQKLTFVEGALDDAYALADLSSVELDDDGKASGMDKALKALAKSKPYLFRVPGAVEIDGSAGTGSGMKPAPDKTQEETALKQRFNIR